MAAPLVAFFVAFLTGAAAPVIAGHVAFGGAEETILIVDQRAAKVYAKLPAICAAANPVAQRLAAAADAAKAKRQNRWRAIVAAAADRLARDSAIVCAHSGEANNILGRAKAAAATLHDLAVADGLVPPAKTAAPAPPADTIPAARMCGRQPCR
jgi:hypothetical protein